MDSQPTILTLEENRKNEGNTLTLRVQKEKKGQTRDKERVNTRTSNQKAKVKAGRRQRNVSTGNVDKRALQGLVL